MPKGKYGKQYLYKGQWYFLTELEKMTGVGFQTIKRRVERCGMTVEEAVSIPLQKAQKYKYHGDYYTISELADLTGMTRAGLRHRIVRKGLTPEQAVDMPKSIRGRKISDSDSSDGCKPRRIIDGCVYPDCFHCKFYDCLVD